MRPASRAVCSKPSSISDCIQPISPPAQKASPAPVRTTTSETRIVGGVDEDPGELAVHRSVDGVAAFWPIQRQREDPPAMARPDRPVGGEVDHHRVPRDASRKDAWMSEATASSASAATGVTCPSEAKP